jgi:hypothetical protein
MPTLSHPIPMDAKHRLGKARCSSLVFFPRRRSAVSGRVVDDVVPSSVGLGRLKLDSRVQPSLTGLACLLIITRDCVQGYFQPVPTGLTWESVVLAQTLKPVDFSALEP